MDFDIDGFRLAETLLGVSAPMLQFALLGVGAALLLGALFWPKRKDASIRGAGTQHSQPARPPEGKLVA